jgi:mannosyltransferase OCH1-like enzyme
VNNRYIKSCEPSVFREYIESGQASQNASQIPKIIHQSYKNTPVPPNLDFFHQQVVNMYFHHHYEILLWTESSNLDLFGSLDESVHDFLYMKFANNKLLSNGLFRYLYMFYFGGIYLNLDTKPYKSMEPLLSANHSLYLATTRNSGIKNAFLASQKKHPFWECLIGEIVDNESKWWRQSYQTVENRIGSGMLEYVYEKYPHFNIHVFNSSTILPFDPTNKAFGGYISCDFNSQYFNEELCDLYFKDTEAYSVTYWRKETEWLYGAK